MRISRKGTQGDKFLSGRESRVEGREPEKRQRTVGVHGQRTPRGWETHGREEVQGTIERSTSDGQIQQRFLATQTESKGG